MNYVLVIMMAAGRLWTRPASGLWLGLRHRPDPPRTEQRHRRRRHCRRRHRRADRPSGRRGQRKYGRHRDRRGGLRWHGGCPDLRGALPPARESNFASITDPAKVAELLRAMDAFSGTFVVKSALLISPMVFVRPGELRKAQWADIDLDKAEWRYFINKTKSHHLVPLATQAVATLRELHALTGHGPYVFPGRDPEAHPPAT